MALELLAEKVYAASLPVTKGCVKGLYPTGLLKNLPCDTPINSLETVLTFVKNIVSDFVLPLVGTLFIIMIIAGGIMYITSAGNQQRADGAKKTLTAAIIGLIIVILAYTIIAVFAKILGGTA